MQGTQVRPRGQREPGARRRYLDSKLVGAVGSQGISVALSADSNMAILGGRNDILAQIATGASQRTQETIIAVMLYRPICRSGGCLAKPASLVKAAKSKRLL
jgi:hypothetical protein